MQNEQQLFSAMEGIAAPVPGNPVNLTDVANAVA